jgi:hypothetical protein
MGTKNDAPPGNRPRLDLSGSIMCPACQLALPMKLVSEARAGSLVMCLNCGTSLVWAREEARFLPKPRS